MQKLAIASFLALLSFGLENKLQAESTLIDVGSAAHHNVMEAHSFLLNSNQLESAAYTAAQLQKKRLYWMPKNDFWGGENADGYTYAVGDQYLRDDMVHPNYSFNMMLPPSDHRFRDFFARGAQLVNVIIHENYHLADYQIPPYINSSELETYYRSYLAYVDILVNYLMKNFEIHSSIGSPDAEMWRERAAIYASSIFTEIDTYSEDKYSEINYPFIAPFAHNGCVKVMRRKEFARYFLQLSTVLGKDRGKSYAETLADFDRVARYEFPNESKPACRDREPIFGTAPSDSPVGYAGPRRNQVMYTLDIQKGNTLHIEKMQPNNQIDITVLVENLGDGGDPSQRPIPLQKVGNVYSWTNSGSVYFDRDRNHVVILVNSKTDDAWTQPFQLRVYRTWKDENGNDNQGYVPTQTLSDADQANTYGYNTIAEKKVTLTLDAFSPSLFANVWKKQTGVRFEAKKGDYLRIQLPLFDNRSLNLYRVVREQGSDGYPELKHVGALYSWYNTQNFALDANGVYFAIVERDGDVRKNTDFEISFQFSRNGIPGPTSIPLRAMTADEHRSLGSVQTLQINPQITIDANLSPTSFSSPGSMKAFAMLDLDSRMGDRLRLFDLPNTTIGTNGYVVKEDPQTPGQLIPVQTLYSWYSNSTISIDSSDKHYVVFELATALISRNHGSMRVELNRRTQASGNWAQMRTLSSDEVKKFGFFPIKTETFEKAVLTADSPTGFYFPEYAFQLYEFTLNGPVTHVVMNQAVGQGIQRRFILSRVDEAAFAVGQPALEDLVRTYPWVTRNERDLGPGRYIIAVEPNSRELGPVPFQLLFSSNGIAPTNVLVRPMTQAEMLDPRLRLKVR